MIEECKHPQLGLTLGFWGRYNEHFNMQSRVHKRECFNSNKLQSGRIGDYPGWGYPVVDYLMALHLPNVIAAIQLEELVYSTLSANV